MKKFIPSVVLTAAGFLAAFFVNAFYPAGVPENLKDYDFLGTVLNVNQAYRAVLVILAVLYAAVGFISFFLLKNDILKAKFVKNAPFRFACGIAMALWDILGAKTMKLPQPFFPGPSKIIEAFLIEGGYIWGNTLYSLRLFAVGFLLGVFFGVGTGILIGWFPKINYWVYPVLKITGVIPAVAWMPFALTLFPTPFSGAAFLIVICAWYPVASLTAQGVSSTPKTYFEAARTLGAKTPYLVFRVAVPHAMPNIFTGISTANAFAFTTLVMAEMMGQPGGLGYYINASKVWSAYYKVFAAIIVMALLFSLIMTLTELAQARILRWRKGLVKL